jgi:hypothetical protein
VRHREKQRDTAIPDDSQSRRLHREKTRHLAVQPESHHQDGAEKTGERYEPRYQSKKFDSIKRAVEKFGAGHEYDITTAGLGVKGVSKWS